MKGRIFINYDDRQKQQWQHRAKKRRERAQELRDEGHTIEEIAAKMDVSKLTIRNYLKNEIENEEAKKENYMQKSCIAQGNL